MDRSPENLCVAPRVSVRGSLIHGVGLFADEPIAAGTPIIEYLGERISRAEAERREQRGAGVYLFEYDADTLIDGALGGSDARFANHACVPNGMVRRCEGRVTIVARRDIEAGEELTIDYAFPPGDEPVPCRCASAGCRGVLNERPGADRS